VGALFRLHRDEDQEDIQAVESDGLDGLLEKLRIWRGGFRIAPEHFDASTIGARFYPVLYFLTRKGEARDLGSGALLKKGMLSPMAKLEVHHIFPKKILREAGYHRGQINALANFCFLTKECNLSIGARDPDEYFPKVQGKNPGALESQWIPTDPQLWSVDRFPDFLAERRRLLAEAANRHLASFVEGDSRWFAAQSDHATVQEAPPPGGITSEDERETLDALRAWMREHRLPDGELSQELVDDLSGRQIAVLDLAWPRGIQEGLSAPVAVLLDEDAATHRIATDAGYRCFDSVERFREHVFQNVLGSEAA